MAKRNQYSFSKRQRELKKKKKQEEKRARKRAKNEPEGEYMIDPETGEEILVEREPDEDEEGPEIDPALQS